MPIKILMPALSPTMEKGNLAKWLKNEGDKIKAGDVIAEIETDKATMEVEAVDEGILAKIVVQAGTNDVPVNELIALIAAEGEDAGSVTATSAAPAPKAAPAPAPAPVAAAPAPVPSAPAPVPSAPAPVPSAPVAAAPAHAAAGSRVNASPLARRIAKQEGIALEAISGSGPHGRIIERDVRSALAGGTAKSVASAATPAAGAPTPQPVMASAAAETIKKLFAEGSYVEIPHDGMRKTIARRLTEAKSSIPHFYLQADCEIDALLKLREDLNAAAVKDKDGKPAYKLSVNDMVIKALAMALRAVPDANVSWTDTVMLKHKHADIGVAVSIPGGLITPVIRDACHKSLSTISNEMKDMAARAKDRKLKPEEYQGGSSAVSNLGMFGTKSFSAVINPPHATILAVGAGEQRPIVKGGKIVIATMMSLTMSVDHRAIDGALGAELLAALRTYIEKPLGMLA